VLFIYTLFVVLLLFFVRALGLTGAAAAVRTAACVAGAGVKRYLLQL
jgi:hypothetical protein